MYKLLLVQANIKGLSAQVIVSSTVCHAYMKYSIHTRVAWLLVHDLYEGLMKSNDGMKLDIINIIYMTITWNEGNVFIDNEEL